MTRNYRVFNDRYQQGQHVMTKVAVIHQEVTLREKFADYLEQHTFIAWLFFFLIAPLTVLACVSLVAMIAGFSLLAVL